jgi:Mg2+/Co2+ transporter CorC
MIDPEELMEWLHEHEYSICAPFEDVIDEVIWALNDEFDSEEEFAQIFTEN